MALYTGQKSPSGNTNSRIECRHCHRPFYINTGFTAASGRWNCPYCGLEN
jgi:hypothetical protein